jgi:hypothetical protein
VLFSGVSGGSVYVRWGKNDCPSGASIVYAGYASGSLWGEHGGTSDTHCLPTNPEYLTDDTSEVYMAHLYGIEYELHGVSSPLKDLFNADMPCVVCYVLKSTVLTVPARYTCPEGFSREYYGYMMSEWSYPGSGRPRKDTICVDQNAETVVGSGSDTNPSVVYLMDAQCNGLPCPPYAAKKPLTCAVCSK